MDSRDREAPRLVSVVIPVRNHARFLAQQLAALAAQDYRGAWEVVVADNGSTDGSADVARAMAGDLPAVRVVDALRRRGAAHARNVGAAAAAGDLLAFCDADNAARPGWLAGMAAAATRGDIVAGRLIVDAINDADAAAWFGTPPADRPLIAFDFLPFASGGNAALWSEVFRAVGGYDEGLVVGEDVDLSWRVQLAGYRLVFAPDALMDRRCADRLPAMLRQNWRWGRAAGVLVRRYRPAGLRYRGARADAHAAGDVLSGILAAGRSKAVQGRLLARAAAGAGRAVELVRPGRG